MGELIEVSAEGVDGDADSPPEADRWKQTACDEFVDERLAEAHSRGRHGYGQR